MNPITPAFIAAGTALLLFLTKEVIEARKAKIKKRKEYLICLRSARHEVSSYIPVLNLLKEQMGTVLSYYREGTNEVVSPTYELMPDFLEHLKKSLHAFFEDAELVNRISGCHFELCHVRLRVSLTLAKLDQNHAEYLNPDRSSLLSKFGHSHENPSEAKNVEGLLELIGNTSKLFSDTEEFLKDAISDLEHEIRWIL